jgi:hypothetical protein
MKNLLLFLVLFSLVQYGFPLGYGDEQYELPTWVERSAHAIINLVRSGTNKNQVKGN